jgi:ABC-type multidrug transport system ATPase subunit
MEEADTLCSRVAIMDHGQLIANDEPRNLIESYGAGIIKLKVDEGSWLAEYLTNLDGVDSVTADAQYVHVRTFEVSFLLVNSDRGSLGQKLVKQIVKIENLKPIAEIDGEPLTAAQAKQLVDQANLTIFKNYPKYLYTEIPAGK